MSDIKLDVYENGNVESLMAFLHDRGVARNGCNVTGLSRLYIDEEDHIVVDALENYYEVFAKRPNVADALFGLRKGMPMKDVAFIIVLESGIGFPVALAEDSAMGEKLYAAWKQICSGSGDE